MPIKPKGYILVIEDSPAMADIISYTLSQSGYQVVVSFNMEDALKNFENSIYDLIISDIFMEGMGGVEGIAQIRKLQPNARIIAISGGYSGISPEDALQAASKMGADTILPKPFELDALEQMVSDLLQKTA